jgi:hypothetical protein
MFNLEEKIYLLSVIEEDGNVLPLVQVHTYDEILAEIQDMIKEGWVISDDKLRVTEEGQEAMRKMLMAQKKKKRDWIRPYFQYRRETIDENFIYLPPKITNYTS